MFSGDSTRGIDRPGHSGGIGGGFGAPEADEALKGEIGDEIGGGKGLHGGGAGGVA